MKYVLIFSDGESIEAETCETRKEAHEKMVKSYEEYALSCELISNQTVLSQDTCFQMLRRRFPYSQNLVQPILSFEGFKCHSGRRTKYLLYAETWNLPGIICLYNTGGSMYSGTLPGRKSKRDTVYGRYFEICTRFRSDWGMLAVR